MPAAAPLPRASVYVEARLARLAVERIAERARLWGDVGPDQELFQALEHVYEAGADARQRSEGFEEVYRRLFEKWGGLKLVEEVLEESPAALSRVCSVWMGCADRGQTAGADLGGPGLGELGIAVPAELLLSPDALRLFLRRELLHVEDTLDPAFGYRAGALFEDRPGAMENLARERLRLLWGVSVDGRLARRFPEYASLKAERLAEAKAEHPGFPELAEQIVETLWVGPRPPFANLRDWVRDTARLHAAFLPESSPAAAAHVPGSPCPLCGFPVARVVSDWEDADNGRLARRIGREFEGWRPEQGACERCVEGYAVREGVWL